MGFILNIGIIKITLFKYIRIVLKIYVRLQIGILKIGIPRSRCRIDNILFFKVAKLYDYYNIKNNMVIKMNPRYITDTNKIMKIGDIFIQRTKSQLLRSQGGKSANRERYWVVTEKHHMPDRTTLCCEDDEITLRGHATRKFLLTPKQHDKLYNRALESKDCFNFPLKNYNMALPWMRRFHDKLGFESVPIGDDPIIARALQSSSPVTPKRKRSDSLDTCPKRAKCIDVLVSTHCV